MLLNIDFLIDVIIIKILWITKDCTQIEKIIFNLLIAMEVCECQSSRKEINICTNKKDTKLSLLKQMEEK